MLSTRVIDGLSVYRAGGPFSRELQLQGGTEAQRAQLLRDLSAILTEDPQSAAFRLALGRAENLTRRAGMSIGMSREDEAVLRAKLESATNASLDAVRTVARQHWG